MAEINTITVSGRWGADTDMRYSAKGNAILSGRLASAKPYGTFQEGEEDTSWFKVTIIIGHLAEFVHKYAGEKGMRVAVTGTIHLSSWTDREGNKRVDTVIMANQVIPLTTKQDEQVAPAKAQAASKPAPTKTAPKAAPAKLARNVPQAVEDDEDLPF